MRPLKFDKLPVWARKYIGDLMPERDQEPGQLNRYLDDQSPSIFREMTDPRSDQPYRYIQARAIQCCHAGIVVEVRPESDPERGIAVRFEAEDHSVGRVAIAAEASNFVRCVRLAK